MIRSKLANTFVILLALGPLGIWMTLAPLGSRFVSTNTTLTSLGQVFGLAGLALFSITLVLNTRLKVLDHLFGGLDKTYVSHRNFGGIAFCLLLFHPIFLTFKYLLVSTRSAAFFLLPGNDLWVTLGITALLAMMLLLVFTYYIKLPYHVWKFTHKFLGAAFGLGFVHSFFIVSDINTYAPLRAYMLFLVLMGFLAIVYKTLFGKYLIRKTVYVVKSIKKLNEETWEIDLKPREGLMPYAAGQFVFVEFRGSEISRESHPFSISSAPGDTEFIIVIKNLGDYTSQIGKLKVGDLAYVEGPFGYFWDNGVKKKDNIWIAGGIGITPFLSMARNHKNNNIRVDLYYQVREEREAINLNELEKIARSNHNFRLFVNYSAKTGRLTVQKIMENSKSLEGKEFYICGPAAMMDSFREELQKLNVKKERIHTEEFGLR